MLEVRKAVKDDVSDLANLNFKFNEAIIEHKEIIESLENSKEIVVVALWEKEVIGFVCGQYFKSFCYENLSGEVTELYVKEQFRRKGVAKSLISFLEKELNSMGVKEIKIITNIRNKVAKSVYQSIGYKLKKWVVFNK